MEKWQTEENGAQSVGLMALQEYKSFENVFFVLFIVLYLYSVLLLIMCISHHFIDHTIWMLLKMQHLKLLQ